MKKSEVSLSKAFKVQTVYAVLAIVLFMVTYVVIFSLVIGLTALCVSAGIALVAAAPGVITLLLGIGLASLGGLVLVFLLKFMSTSRKVDRSHLYEVKEADEPRLFRMIQEIVEEVGTTFPKRVYLSAEVNASVFYDSSFWSMFLPVRKNLLIGLGLLNTITEEELKAILAHEFGHFSQKTMKVGSYVYNVNQIIFNLLYDNESYERLIQRWSGISGYISFFVSLAVLIIEGIQWVLRQLYGVVNKNYMALSREMEFHADEIAATITGYEPLKSSLLRMTLSEYALNAVFSFYNERIHANQRSSNVFDEQYFVLLFLAREYQLKSNKGFPEVTFEALSQFNHSKLVIEDQWASHPGTDERIERLASRTDLPVSNGSLEPANGILEKRKEIQETLTQNLYKDMEQEEPVVRIELEQFQRDFKEDFIKNTFPKVYNGYYDNRNPETFDTTFLEPVDATVDLAELFAPEKVNWVNTAAALQNDLAVLQQIINKALKVKTFDYDGVKYKSSETLSVHKRLKKELLEITEKIRVNDQLIFRYFMNLKGTESDREQLIRLYDRFFHYDQEFESKEQLYRELSEALQFISVNTPFEQIEENFARVAQMERQLKADLRELMDAPYHKTDLPKEVRDHLDKYCSKDWSYFQNEQYNNENLEVLFTALNHYVALLSRGYFLIKKELLDHQAQMRTPSPVTEKSHSA